MSEPASKFEEFGFDRDPFSTTIADETIAAQYSLVGRDDQEYRLREFVRDGLREPNRMKRRLIFGEYGTGKSHHLIKLRDEVREGISVEGRTYDAIGVYVGNLGLSIRRLYEEIVEEIKTGTPELSDFIDSLESVEPETSVDDAYKYEKLQDNIVTNLRRLISEAREKHGYRSVFLFIDEAEDIASETDNEKVQRFVRSFLHLVNELNTSGLHILLGFSQGARMAITEYEDDEDAIGNALVQRFQGNDIYLGDLTSEDAKEMLIDRMDVHRTTNKGAIAPIVEDTVEVVTRITGGHPRSILRIYSEALNYAADIDADRIDGGAIVYALTGFTSLVRDEELLSQDALGDLKQAVDEAHPDAREDFERLSGRLIGEAEAVPKDAFTEGVPDALTRPISIPDDDIGELRVLEQRSRHGRYSYVLSEAAEDFLFRGQAEEGTEIQQLDLKASNAPDKYQQDLSRGLGLALQQTNHGSLHKDPVTEPVDRYEYGLYLIDIEREAGKRNQTVALGVYNGQEISEELVRAYVKALRDRGASFGALLKQNQPRSGEANRYLNEAESPARQAYRERVVELDLSTEQRDNFVYGRLLALGDAETDAGDLVDQQILVDEIGIIDRLDERFEKELLPYPNSRLRAVIDHLEAEDTREFTITDLREELDLKDYELNKDIMEGLAGQNLVKKAGQRWVYPDIENDRPPWHEVYRHINESDEPLIVPEIKDQLAQEYAFDCPQGDENAMFQWYLEHLQRQNYVEPVSVTRNGSTVEGYDVVSVEGKYNEALDRAQERLRAARELYQEAVDLKTEGINEYSNRLDDFETTLDQHKEIFDPDNADLNTVETLTDNIIDLEEELEEEVEDRQDAIINEAKRVRDAIIEPIKQEIDEADVEGALGSQLEEYREELQELEEELQTLIDNQQYERLLSRTDPIETRAEEIDEEIEAIVGLKGRCTKKFSELRDLTQEAKEQIEDIAEENDLRTNLQKKLADANDILQEYRAQFNNGEYETALETLEGRAEPKITEIKSEAKSVATQQTNYLGQLNDLEGEIMSEEGQELIQEAREAVRRGDFAEAPVLIDDVKDLITGPTRREQFIAALKESNGRFSILLAETDFDQQEAFNYLKQTYDQEVEEIEVVIE